MPESTTPFRVFYRDLGHVFSPTRLLAAILLAQLFVGIFAIQEKPLFENQSDEVGHLQMARYVADQGHPPGPEDIDWSPDALQFTQPPLYYFLTAPLIELFDDGSSIPGQPNPNAVCNGYNTNLTTWARPSDFSIAESGAVRVGYLLRGLQLVFALATTYLTFRCTRLLFPQNPDIALCAAGLIAFLPTLTSTTAFIGNDWPVIFIGTFALYVTLRTLRTTTPMQGMIGFGAIVILGAIAALTKVTGWTVFVLALPILGHLLSKTRITRRSIVVLSVTVIAAGLLVAVFNLVTYGSVIGRYPDTWLNVHLPVQEIVGSAASEFWNSIVLGSRFDANAIPGLARASEVSLLVVVLSLLWLLPLGFRSAKLVRALAVPLLLLLACAGLLFLRNLTAVNPLYIFAPFRYLGPGIPALAIISAAALSKLPGAVGRTAQILIPVCWLMLSLLASTLSDAAVTRRAADITSLPAEATLLQVDQSERPLSVAGYFITPNDTFADGAIDLTLYLVGNETGADGLAMLDLQAGATSCRLIPVRGFRPNTSIAEGEWLAAHIELPYCGDETEAPIPISVSWRSVSADGRTTTPLDEALIPLTVIPAGLARPASDCQPNLGTLGDAFQLIKVDFPTTIANHEALHPSVNWLVKSTTSNSYLRVYSLTDASGNEVARCQDVPRTASYPTTAWREGEVVYDDSCTIQLPDALAAGNYDLWIGMIDTANNRYLPHDGSEGEDLLRLGSIAITAE